MAATYITFGIYLVAMLAIGIYFYFKSAGVEDYLLGGRGIGSFVTALSAQASDMSGWLLMGLPGVVYMSGLCNMYVAIGLWIGTLLNWLLVAPRLRIYTERTKSLTLSSFFGRRFRDRSGMLRLFSAVVVLLFFSIYAASSLVAAGKLFNSLFNIDYHLAVCVGAAVILLYTIMGGYLAVCWTDLIQGALMFFALIIVPVVAYFKLPPDSAALVHQARPAAFDLLPQAASPGLALLAVVSAAVWGLGYFGQPHILVRFMSVKSVKQLPRSTMIAMIWVTISLAAAVAIGLLAIPFFPGLSAGDSEKVFIYMIGDFFNPWLGGILLAAILAAIMSTIDSQLLVASSTLTADFYKNILRKKASSKEQLHVSRVFLFMITVAALLMALNKNNNIFTLVTFAWGGFGAAFGPVVLMGLFSRRTSWQSALCGMASGTVVMVAWYATGFSVYMYELLPGFLAGLAAILVVNRYFPETNPKVLKEFDHVREILRKR